eukprot:632507-Pelagomonas_calceolata.AAC.2
MSEQGAVSKAAREGKGASKRASKGGRRKGMPAPRTAMRVRGGAAVTRRARRGVAALRVEKEYNFRINLFGLGYTPTQDLVWWKGMVVTQTTVKIRVRYEYVSLWCDERYDKDEACRAIAVGTSFLSVSWPLTESSKCRAP